MSSPLFFLSFSSSRSHSLAAPTTLALVLPLCFPLLCSSSLLFFSLPPSRSPSLTVPTALAVALPFFLFFFSLCLPVAAFVEDVHTYLSQLGLDVNSALSFLQERLQQYRLVEIKLLAQQRAQASAIQIYKESIGTALVNDAIFGDPVQKAEAMAFRRAFEGIFF